MFFYDRIILGDGIVNKKGFTFIELLAVIVILSVITTLTVVSYKSYTKKVKQEELITLRETVESSYNNYRTKAIYNNETVPEKVYLSVLRDNGFLPNGLNYNRVNLKDSDYEKSYVKIVKKGNIINKYLNGGDCNLGEMAKYGICKTEIDDSDVNIDGDKVDSSSVSTRCITADAGSLTNYCTHNNSKVIVYPSEEEVLCLYIVLTPDNYIYDSTIINDFYEKDNAGNLIKPYCVK